MSISKENILETCSECGNEDLYRDPNRGELVCKKCGMVVSGKQVSHKPEWRAFNLVEREKLPRTGSPMTLTIHDGGLSTNIGWRNIDYAGKVIDPETRSKIYRLRKWNRRSKISNSRNRNLYHALSLITKIGQKLNLPHNVLETSSILYRKALRRNLIRGRTILNVVVSTIYIACRQCGIVRSLTDVAEAANITRKTAARIYRYLYRELNLDVPEIKRSGYVSRLVSRLELHGKTEILAKRIMEEATDNKLTLGRSPAGIAAACVYISSFIMNERRTQNIIAHEAQVTEVTIRNRYKELLRNLDILIQT